MPVHKMTPCKVETAGPGKYEDSDGLRLVLSRTGTRKWRLRFTLHGKRREMGLGSLPITRTALLALLRRSRSS